jgi:hypothetical protein
MKLRTILNFVFLILQVVIFSSCDNDSNSVGTKTPELIIFSQDSLSVWLEPSVSASGSDSAYYSINAVGELKVEFTLQANADSTHSIGYWGIYTNATPSIPIIPVIISTIDVQSSANLNFNKNGETYFAFGMRLYVKNSTIPHYARLKNIKITRKQS